MAATLAGSPKIPSIFELPVFAFDHGGSRGRTPEMADRGLAAAYLGFTTQLAMLPGKDYLSPMLLAVLGTPEIIIIVAVILLLFGPSKLPALGSGIGKMLRGFKKEMRSIDEESSDRADVARDEIDVTPKGSIEAKDAPKT